MPDLNHMSWLCILTACIRFSSSFSFLSNSWMSSLSNLFSRDGNYTKMLRAILNKSWRQHPKSTNYTAICLPSRKLYKLDEPESQDTAGEARTNTSVMYSYGPPHIAKQKQDDQLEHTYSSYVRIWDVALKTCQKRWMIGRSGERGSGVSVLTERHYYYYYYYYYPYEFFTSALADGFSLEFVWQQVSSSLQDSSQYSSRSQ